MEGMEEWSGVEVVELVEGQQPQWRSGGATHSVLQPGGWKLFQVVPGIPVLAPVWWWAAGRAERGGEELGKTELSGCGYGRRGAKEEGEGAPRMFVTHATSLPWPRPRPRPVKSGEWGSRHGGGSTWGGCSLDTLRPWRVYSGGLVAGTTWDMRLSGEVSLSCVPCWWWCWFGSLLNQTF